MLKRRWYLVDKRRFTIVTSPVCAGEVVLRYSLGQVNGEGSEAEESATYKVGEEVMGHLLKGRRAPLGDFTTRRRMICRVRAKGTIGKRRRFVLEKRTEGVEEVDLGSRKRGDTGR